METRRQTFIDNLDVGILEQVIHRVYTLPKNVNVGIWTTYRPLYESIFIITI